MVIVLMGKSCSGKDTVCNELVKKGYKKIVTYTTRPIRPGEEDGKTYHYISDEEFKTKASEGFFAEWKSYLSAQGLWYYGSAVEDYETKKDSVIILTPRGLKDVQDKFLDVKVIYLYANSKTIAARMKHRKDDPTEAARRIKADNEDFKGVENLADRIIYNNEGLQLDDLMKTVMSRIKEWKK